MSVRALLTVSLLVMAPGGMRADAAPNVMVSIAPVHSLVASIMEGVTEPRLLVPPGASPHAFALRPSDMRGLHDADLVIWIGGSLERFLAKPMATLDETSARIKIAALPGIALLSVRRNGAWNDMAVGQNGHARTADPHLWLDPDNARVIVRQVATHLARLDAPNARRYEINAERTVRRLMALDARLNHKLQTVANRPYVVFHDAYRYFAKHYGLTPAGSITTSPEISPGARRIVRIRQIIETQKVRCVFSEPPFMPALVRTVLEDTDAGHGVLDPEGAQIPPGPNGYFTLMERLADSLVECLSR